MAAKGVGASLSSGGGRGSGGTYAVSIHFKITVRASAEPTIVASAKPTAAANAYPTKNKVRIKVLCFYLIDLN